MQENIDKLTQDVDALVEKAADAIARSAVLIRHLAVEQKASSYPLAVHTDALRKLAHELDNALAARERVRLLAKQV